MPQGNLMVEKSKQLFSFLKEVYREFIKDNGPLFAAAISFFGITSLIPLLLLAVGVFGHIIGSRESALQKVVAFIGDYIPVGTTLLQEYLMSISRQSSVLSGLGLVGLLWVGTQVFVILQQVMNIALGVKEKPSLLRARGIALLLVVVAGILFALSIAITSLITAARSFQPTETFPGIAAVWQIVGILVTTIISILAFTFIYRFAPTKNVGAMGPVIGGVTAGLLFETAKYLFRWYVTNLGNYSNVYGSLATAIILVVWIYYVALITVLGAEVASVYALRKARTGSR